MNDESPVFGCGTEAADWMERNCNICKLYDMESAEDTECEFGNRISMGFLGEAPTRGEAVRFGGEGFYNICSQREVREDYED